MKRVLQLLALAGAAAGAVWYARQQSEPRAAAPTGEWTARPQLRAVPEPAAETAPAPQPSPGDTDDLTEIKGIGPKFAEQLLRLGIDSFEALAAADPDALAEQLDGPAAVESWIGEARARLEG